MTTILAIRDKSGVHIASDSKGTHFSGRISKLNKFFPINNGYLAYAGSVALGEMFREVLTTDKYVNVIKAIDLSKSTKEDMGNFIELYAQKFVELSEIDLPYSVKDGSIKQYFQNIENHLSKIIYIDASRLIEIELSFVNGAAKVTSFNMQIFNSDSCAVCYMGSGGGFAYEYYQKYLNSGYSLYETMKNAILYAMTKDIQTGLDAVIEEVARAN